MRALKARAGARLVPISQAAQETGLALYSIEKLIARRVLRVIEVPHIRRRFLDRRELDAAIESWKVPA